jgi:hypothetical protein
MSTKCTVEGCGKWSFQGGVCRGHFVPQEAAPKAAAAALAWDDKKQLDELLLHMFGFVGTRAGKFDPNSWQELQKHFTLSRDVCLAHAKANLETICSMGFCCYAGSDGDHFHSLGNGSYESFYSERGSVDSMEKLSADQAAEMLLDCLCKVGHVAFKP